jgi:hypothetical protein
VSLIATNAACLAPTCWSAKSAPHRDSSWPIVREFTIHCGHRQACGKQLRGRDRLQPRDATGAAQSQLGADAQAAIIYRNKRAGLSHGKIADTF